jgi:hypothetical protein
MPPKRKNYDNVAADSSTKKTKAAKKESSTSNEGESASNPLYTWQDSKTTITVLR